MVVPISQEKFLSNSKNKEKLITMLIKKLEAVDINTKQARVDADVLIIATAIEESERQRTEVIRLETQYWTLVDIPKQEKQETVPAFVLRACAIMEKSQKSGEGVKTSAKLAEEAQDKRERIERLENMTTSLIDAENTQMTNDLYRLLKKYSGLRNLIRQLKTEYTNAKIYPMVIRYSMLKDMIKDIMLHPDYMEVCHEVDA
ncbi:uncharacterized protein [Leptinotarsa decemlineata]|uniref:uncharacterized protein n=1 Tax=Leptinotarsa decemlineata TaxID=7539 RepID=UPI003D305EFD